MNITLEMVDQVIERTGATYQDAKKALLENDGDVLEAIVSLEGEDGFDAEEELTENAIVKLLKDLIEKGKISKIIVEKDGNQILNLPVAAGIISGIIFSGASITAIVAAYVTGCDIFIINKEEEKINVKDYSKEKYDSMVSKIKKDNKDDEEIIEEEDDDIMDY